MRLGIMQPYFFPYLGHFELIYKTDRWLVFDIVEFRRKTWMTRNRILHPTEGWQYVGLSVNKFSLGTLIKDIVVQEPEAARAKIVGQLNHYRLKAPNFKLVTDLVNEVFSEFTSGYLVDLNVKSLEKTCEILDIPFNYSKCSEMNMELGDIEHAGQWALRICQALGADSYLNPPGGKEIFKQHEWDEAGIKLDFTDNLEFQYATKPYGFVENLSILDVLMWNNPSDVVQAIAAR